MSALNGGRSRDSANEMAQEARAELWEHGDGDASSTDRPFDLKEDFTGSEEAADPEDTQMRKTAYCGLGGVYFPKTLVLEPWSPL